MLMYFGQHVTFTYGKHHISKGEVIFRKLARGKFNYNVPGKYCESRDITYTHTNIQ